MRAALLSQDDPATFGSVLTLEDHGETRPPPQQQRLAALCCRMQRALQAGAGVQLEDTLLQRVVGCILVNAFVRASRVELCRCQSKAGVWGGGEVSEAKRGPLSRHPVILPCRHPAFPPSRRARGAASSACLQRVRRMALASS